MAAPSALVLECEECGEVPHRVLSGRVAGTDEVVFQGTVKCSSCGRVRSVTVREDRPMVVPIIVSDGNQSERGTIELGPDEVVRVGEKIDYADHHIEVTAVEVGERRVESAKARDVRTLWAKRADRIRVKISVNKGNRTVTHVLEAAPDEEFEVGDIVDLGRERALIHRIHIGTRALRHGAARAEDITRMYGRIVRERTSY
ncbi:MAG TPA: HVO_0476 family zinc finger protein [Thermoplasmata archaeon]|nr:HVO_0476 family zinc finger protein [Thermoplasmata archaeon]